MWPNLQFPAIWSHHGVNALIWCTNHSHFLVNIFCKCRSFIWECFFSVIILEKTTRMMLKLTLSRLGMSPYSHCQAKLYFDVFLFTYPSTIEDVKCYMKKIDQKHKSFNHLGHIKMFCFFILKDVTPLHWQKAEAAVRRWP